MSMSCEGCAYKNSDHPTFWSQRSATLYNGRAPQTMTSRSCKHPSTCTPPLHVLQRTTYSTLLDLCRNTYSSPMNPKIRNYCLALKSLLLNSLSLKRFFPDIDEIVCIWNLPWPWVDPKLLLPESRHARLRSALLASSCDGTHAMPLVHSTYI